MGDVLNYGLLEMERTWSNEYNICSFTHAMFHYFGDPTMEVVTQCPTPITGVQVVQDRSTITVSCDTVGYKIIVASKYDSSYFQVAQNCESATFTNVRVPCTITVTNPNHIPYVFNEDVTISNKTITEQCAVVGNDITIYNTTVDYSGDLTIDASGDVIIYDQFESNGSFEIK